MAKKKVRPTVGLVRKLQVALKNERERFRDQKIENDKLSWDIELVRNQRDNAAAPYKGQIEKLSQRIALFNQTKAKAWWQGPVRSRINGVEYMLPDVFADHLTREGCIIEEQWLTEARTDDTSTEAAHG